MRGFRIAGPAVGLCAALLVVVAAACGPAGRSAPPVTSPVPAGSEASSRETGREGGGQGAAAAVAGTSGIALQEIAAMSIDPIDEAGKAGFEIITEPGYGMTAEDSYIGQARLGRLAPNTRTPADLGFVIGYQQFAWAENKSDDCCDPGDPRYDAQREAYRQYLSARVLLFDSERGARDFMQWLPDTILAPDDAPASRELPELGADAVLWTSRAQQHFVDLAFVRRGRMVGEVVTRGLESDGFAGAANPLAGALARQMDSVPLRAEPYSASQVLAAPLGPGQWKAVGRHGATYPDLVAYPDGELPEDPQAASCSGHYDFRDPGGGPCGPERILSGLVVSYTVRMVTPQLEDDGAPSEWYPVAGTELMVFKAAQDAAVAMGELVDRQMAGPGGKAFTVPGVAGAAGVRTWTPGGSIPADFEGFTWNVYVTHGAAVARTFVAGGPDSSDVDYLPEDEADWDRNRQWAIDAANAWDAHLDRVLGRQTAHTQLPSASPTAAGPTQAAPTQVAPTQAGPTPTDPQRSGATPGSASSPVAGPRLSQSPAVRPATIATGGGRSCALHPGGQVWCWGTISVVNADGQPPTGWNLNPPTEVPGSHEFAEVSVGASQACGLDTAGRAWCWGYDWAGQLGDGGALDHGSNAPVAVAGGHTFATISAGEHHTCALDTNGRAWCWGQFGEAAGDEAGRASPAQIGGTHTFATLASGSEHTCAIDTRGRAWCWGADADGQLGDGPSGTGFARTPVAVVGGHTFALIAAGARHTCALDTSGKGWCWGMSDEGALAEGPGDAGPVKHAPVAVAGSHTFTTITAGATHTCALDPQGAGWCWGSNAMGSLGTGDPHSQAGFLPLRVSGEHEFDAIAAGGSSTCALDTSGRAWCWGDDQGGQLGQGAAGTPACEPESSSVPCSATPLAVTVNRTFAVH